MLCTNVGDKNEGNTLAWALNLKSYDEDLIAQSNEKRIALHKDKEVANGVKKAFLRFFPICFTN